MPTSNLEIERANPALPKLSARLDGSSEPQRRSVVLLAHGAGVDVDHPWMTLAATELAARGLPVLRFRYPYMELAARAGRRRPPDPAPVLEEAHVDALETLRRLFPARRWLLAGKSLGARIATHIAAKGAHAHGLVLLGYPLHPPRRPDKLRAEHFATLAQPALFVHGDRDEFGALDELRAALERYSGRAELCALEGADHSFEGPRRRDLRAVLSDVAQRVVDWEARTFPD